MNSDQLRITFPKNRYHELNDMVAWVIENIGVGGWSYDLPTTWEGIDDAVWVVKSAFGTTTFAFKYEIDYTVFVMRFI